MVDYRCKLCGETSFTEIVQDGEKLLICDSCGKAYRAPQAEQKPQTVPEYQQKLVAQIEQLLQQEGREVSRLGGAYNRVIDLILSESQEK